MKTELTDVDITEEILELAEEQVGEGEKDKQRRAEDLEDEGLRVETLQKQLSKVEAMVSELESGIETDTKAVKKVRERIDDRESEEEFQREYDRDTIDAKDYDRVVKVLEDYESMVSRLAIERQALLATYFQLKSMVDHQQLVHDEDRIVESVKDIQESLEEIYEKNLDSTTDIFQRQVESLYSNMEELQEEMNSVKKTQAKRDGELRDAINSLASAIEDMPSQEEPSFRGRGGDRPARSTSSPAPSKTSSQEVGTPEKEEKIEEEEEVVEDDDYINPTEISDLNSFIEGAEQVINSSDEVRNKMNYESEAVIRYLNNNPVKDRDRIEEGVNKFIRSREFSKSEVYFEDLVDTENIPSNRISLAIGALRKSEVMSDEFNFDETLEG